MIDFIEGTVEALGTEYVVIEAGGLGYRVGTTASTLSALTKGTRVRLHTHYHVREDVVALYGFLELRDRDLFVQLQEVSGIGPKGALALLSRAGSDRLADAIRSGDVKYLVSLPGIGQKTAGRLVLELKGRLPDWSCVELDPATGGRFHHTVHAAPGLETDVIAGLLALGYNEREAALAVRTLLQDSSDDEPPTVERLLRASLRLLSRA